MKLAISNMLDKDIWANFIGLHEYKFEDTNKWFNKYKKTEEFL